jgi:putative ABC transport system substrate-binding protein
VAVAVRAQPPGVPVIGFLNQEAAELTASNVTGFRKDLSEAGFVENQNVVIEYRWGEADQTNRALAFRGVARWRRLAGMTAG